MDIRVKITRDNSNEIKTMDLEEYLRCVVPSEMPSSWSFEALKAQAVASRTYAMRKIQRRKKYDFDVDDTVNYQAYRIGHYKDSTDKAITETKGIYITYKNEVIDAVFSSANGGMIRSALEKWGSEIPYLIAKVDPYCKKERNAHSVGMCQYGANEMAKQGFNYEDILYFYYYNVNIIKPIIIDILEDKEVKNDVIKYATVRYRSRGSLVEILQSKLNEYGWGLVVDGIFGLRTLKAVKEFQKLNKIIIDGIGGNQTWSKIHSVDVMKK